jgi:hypothetical protein
MWSYSSSWPCQLWFSLFTVWSGYQDYFSLYNKKLTIKQTEKIVPDVVPAIETLFEVCSSPPFWSPQRTLYNPVLERADEYLASSQKLLTPVPRRNMTNSAAWALSESLHAATSYVVLELGHIFGRVEGWEFEDW